MKQKGEKEIKKTGTEWDSNLHQDNTSIHTEKSRWLYKLVEI